MYKRQEDFLPCVFPFLPVNSLLLFLMCLHFSLPAYIISCAKPAHDQHSSLAEHMHVFFSLALILSFNRNFCNVNNNSVNFLFSSFGYNKLIKTKTCCHTAASQFFLRKETRKLTELLFTLQKLRLNDKMSASEKNTCMCSASDEC